MIVLAKPVRTMPVIKEKDTKAFIEHFNITSENSPASVGGGMNRPD